MAFMAYFYSFDRVCAVAAWVYGQVLAGKQGALSRGGFVIEGKEFKEPEIVHQDQRCKGDIFKKGGIFFVKSFIEVGKVKETEDGPCKEG